ncbi:MAG: hypothetical protein CL402_06945 [Acidiferrobacteraceae bacterium]|nr:hypothetical protein [Acidiferrobacteraceae bacterium]
MSNSRTLAENIADILKDVGIQRIFGVPGGGSSLDIIDAAASNGIEFILCQTECAAAIMASVTGELSGIPGVVITGIGPGAASVSNGVAYAFLEKSPLIVLTDTHQETATRPPHQIFDQNAFFKPITKKQIHLTPVNGSEDFAAMLSVANQSPPGPVHINLSAYDASQKTPPPSKQLNADMEIKNIKRKLLSEGRRIITQASKPVLIIGHQCRPNVYSEACRSFAHQLGGAVMTTYKAKGVFPENNFLFAGHFTNAKADHTLLEQSDLIVFCGVDPVEMIPGKWPHKIPVMVLSETKTDSWPFVSAIELIGNLRDITKNISSPTHVNWTKNEIGKQRRQLRRTIQNNSTSGRSPDFVIDTLVNTVPENVRLTVDAGAHMFSTMARWRALDPYDVLKSNGLSTMGFAIPAGIASWLQDPVRPAVCVTGDGGLMMCLGELSTAARLNANITVIVLNDASLSLIDIKQQRQQRPPIGVRTPRVNFAEVARALGCETWKVNTQDPIEFAFKEALETDGPTLVDVTIDPSGYRAQLTALRG